MSTRNNKELFEAICFFGQKSIVKEMRYSEFEAVLDGVVGIAELAKREVNAAYVKINQSLQIHSVVTFQIEFNERGFADEDWNIPLRHLAENAGPGPDLGGGPIRLACRSQCSVSWYQRELWEPNQREINHFQLLKDAITRNKLGLITSNQEIPILSAPAIGSKAQPEPEVPVISETVDITQLRSAGKKSVDEQIKQKLIEKEAEYQKKLDLLVQMQKQTLQGLEEKYREEIDQVKRAMRNEAQSVRHKAQDLEQQANQNKVLLEKLQTRNMRLEREHLQYGEQIENQKDQYDDLKDEYLELLRNQRGVDDDKSRQIAELKELLTAKAVQIDELADELNYAQAKNTELASKLEGYQRKNLESNQNTTDQLSELNSALEFKQNEIAELKALSASGSGERKRLEQQINILKENLAKAQSATESYEAERESKTTDLAEMKQALKKAEFKVQEQDQKLINANSVNEKLRLELAEVEQTSDSSNELFDKIEKLELVFVAYHPGAGHISLPARQLDDYLEKPLAFAAQKCAVTLEHYKSWLLHYDNAECEECGIPVKRIDTPSDFQPGINDRCTKHRVVGGNVAMFRKTS